MSTIKINALIEKYKREWQKAHSNRSFETPKGYTKVNLIEVGKMEAFAMILDDLVLNGNILESCKFNCLEKKDGPECWEVLGRCIICPHY